MQGKFYCKQKFSFFEYDTLLFVVHLSEQNLNIIEVETQNVSEMEVVLDVFEFSLKFRHAR